MAKSKSQTNTINPETVSGDIDNVVNRFFESYGINIFDIQQCKSGTHNILTLCMMQIYNELFKPDKPMINNQHSKIDYNDNVMLSIVADKFIELSLRFNKSLGLMQFGIMSGIHRETLAIWRDNPELNPIRSDIIKSICECHKMEQINLLNDTPVGALAVANNDTETGLNWSANQAQTITNNTVYYLPSERSDRLKLDKQPSD